ncbi:GNAT family N-acetyltransferase [Streptomyces wuyuanensis]|uniref:Ribosomal protein S18 acetylase RimI n=1 Tax=Streptomyces wuyuanensis TaxID=1196353 RepID=A0A1G9YUV4_9ACTN|nr:GNAT family N-acetyltransferase [Streptomyces wuyuanensis]SDN12146.1 Ribosomal protein S18 acetylase RimI [Streptomyces wuyuanensis]
MTDHPPPAPLPDPYRSRPATAADAFVVHRLVAACERERLGRIRTGLDAVAADLRRPGLNPAMDTLLVHAPSGAVAGRAWVHGGRRCRIDVHPGHRGRGLGAALLVWAEARARQVGGRRLAQTVCDGDRAAVVLLRSRGYSPFVTQWLLEITLLTEPAVPEPPEGVTVRPFRSGDERAAHQLTEDAFAEWQKRRKPYEEWARLTVERDTFAPEVSSVAFAGGHMVGAVLALDVPGADEGYIDRVAVRADHRNRGLAGLLLRETFRGFHGGGQRVCTLWTHSRTGALSLYERAGMTVRHSSTVFGKDLPQE